MKILYLSTPFFADCDFPLVKALQEAGHEVTYLIMLAPYSKKSTLLDIKEMISENAIIPATRYPEMKLYEKYMDMSKVLVANRTGQGCYFLSFWKHKYDLYRFIKHGNFDQTIRMYYLNYKKRLTI